MNTAGCARGHPLFVDVKALIFGTLGVNFAGTALVSNSSFQRCIFLKTHLLAEVHRVSSYLN
jgi:hypothetical protein